MNIDLVKQIIDNYAKDYSGLEIKEVDYPGHDNFTYRIGNEFSIRLPSGKSYAKQIVKEQKWVNYLQDNMSMPLPKCVLYVPSCDLYEFGFIINKWIDGDVAFYENDLNKILVAKDCAKFLKELHKIDSTGAPKAGEHNFYRGGDILVYEEEALMCIEKTKEVFDEEILKEVWRLGANSKLILKNVFVHGDFEATNILVKNDRLSAVIDFGILGVGEPSCDLAMYWTFFECESASAFKNELNLSNEIWLRARAWVLWKQLLVYTNDNSERAKDIVNRIIKEYKEEVNG